MAFSPLNYTILLAYLAGMMVIGWHFARRQKTTEDYFLAGRRMPWLVVAMSMYASLTSATTYLALPGKAFAENISLIVVCAVSPLLVPFLVFLFYPFYRNLRVTTSYEYIGKRFGRSARTTVSCLFILARMGWLGTVVYAPALAFTTVTGTPLWMAILGMGLLATAYTSMGGLSAVLWTDAVQFIILVAGAVWVATSLALTTPGGVAGVLDVAGQAGHLKVLDLRPSLTEMTGLMVGLSFLLSMMQDYGTDQITVQRLQATGSFRGVVRASIFNAGTDFLIIGILLFIGLGIFAYSQAHPGFLDPAIKPDQVLPYYVLRRLPDGVSGLVITAVFAAAMSSLDSGINSVATVISHDFIRPSRRRPLSAEVEVRRARYMTIGLGVASTGVAFYVSTIGDIIEAFATFVSRFSAPVLALFLLGMLTKRASFRSWVAGAVLGVLGTWAVQRLTPVNWTYYFPLSFLTTFGTALLFSLVRPGPAAAAGLTIWDRGDHGE